MTYYKYDTHTESARQRFESKYNVVASGCWEWNRYRDADGYGQFTFNFTGKKYNLRAHRFSWLLANRQDWPADKPVARHTCNNPCCVNPNHIVPGTASENTLDSIAAGTFVKNRGAARPVSTPIGNFDSGQQAAQALGISHNTLIKWISSNKPGFSYSAK